MRLTIALRFIADSFPKWCEHRRGLLIKRCEVKTLIAATRYTKQCAKLADQQVQMERNKTRVFRAWT